MTALWHHLDDSQRLAIICALTMLAGLCIGAAACLRIVREEREARTRHEAWRAQVNDAIAVVQAWRAEMEELEVAELRGDIEAWERGERS